MRTVRRAYRATRRTIPQSTHINSGAPFNDRPAASGQVAVHLGEEPGEVELVGAGGAGGLEVGAGPVAGLGGERGVLAAGLGADAVVLVVGEEPGQVAELGLWCRRRPSSGRRSRRRASGRRRGRRRGAGGSRRPSAARSGGRRRRSRGAGRCSCIETHEPLIRSSVQIACSRPW